MIRWPNGTDAWGFTRPERWTYWRSEIAVAAGGAGLMYLFAAWLAP